MRLKDFEEQVLDKMVDGDIVQAFDLGEWMDIGYSEKVVPIYKIQEFDYRIKPKPEQSLWDYADFKDNRELWFVQRKSGETSQIDRFSDAMKVILIQNDWISAEKLCDRYTREDGKDMVK